MISPLKHTPKRHWWYWIIGFCALVWLLIRSGTNPKRLAYPCQRAAFPLATSWLYAVVAFIGGGLLLRRFARITLGALTVAGAAWLLVSIATSPRADTNDIGPLPTWEVADPISALFVMDAIPATGGSLAAGDETVPDEYLADAAIDTLLLLMAAKDIHLHRTASQPAGIVGADNVVVIKGNFQWTSRNTTSTDRIKGIIWRILQHPDGFTGEVLVCDNTQSIGTGISHNDNNSEDPQQSILDVASTFLAKGYPVHCMDWREFGSEVVFEYDIWDYRDGYVYDSDTKVSYPKFKSPSGNHYVSFRHGVWDSLATQYDESRLCIIDFPVLKAHEMAGATVAVKNWIGVLTTAYQDERYGGWTLMHYSYFWGPYALVARVMTETYPRLTIVDAAWVSTNNANDLNYLVNTNMLLASTDPVAASWYAAKFILVPIAERPGQADPDLPGRKYNETITNWTNYFHSQGIPCTRDSTEMSVYDRAVLSGTPVFLAAFSATRRNGNAVLHGELSRLPEDARLRFWRQADDGERLPIGQALALSRPTFEFVDPSPPAGDTDYWFQLLDPTDDEVGSWFGPARLASASPPSATVLQSVHPNPFNPKTTVAFTVNRPQHLRISVFDMTGRRVVTLADRTFETGRHAVDWTGRDSAGRAAPSGTYLVRMVSEEREDSRKAMLVR